MMITEAAPRRLAVNHRRIGRCLSRRVYALERADIDIYAFIGCGFITVNNAGMMLIIASYQKPNNLQIAIGATRDARALVEMPPMACRHDAEVGRCK